MSRKSYKYCEFCGSRVKSKHRHYQESPDCKLANEEKIKEDELKLENWESEKTIECKICGYRAKELTRHLKTEHRMTVDEYREKYREIISDYEKLKKSIFWRKRNAGENNPMYEKRPWNTDANREDEIIEKLGSTWRGKSFSKKHKEKLASAKEGVTGENANAYGPHNISKEGRRRMREGSLKGKKHKYSKGEIELGIYLFELEPNTEHQYKVDFYQCDYYLPSYNVIVEYDGDWHHYGIHNEEADFEDLASKIQRRVYYNDLRKTESILQEGYKLVRILESEFYSHKKKGDVKKWLRSLLE